MIIAPISCWKMLRRVSKGNCRRASLLCGCFIHGWIRSVKWLKNSANCAKKSCVKECRERSEFTNVKVYSYVEKDRHSQSKGARSALSSCRMLAALWGASHVQSRIVFDDHSCTIVFRLLEYVCGSGPEEVNLLLAKQTSLCDNDHHRIKIIAISTMAQYSGRL